MKRVISFILSFVMLFSIVGTVDLSAYAEEDDDTLFELILTKDNIQYFKDYFLSDLDPTKQAFYIDYLTEMNHENDETHMQIVQDSVNRVQKKWSQILEYMPESITNSQIVAMGNKTFSYLNGTIEVFKNIGYIKSNDTRISQKCYHGLHAVNTAINLIGLELGPIGVALKILEKFFIFSDLMYVTFMDQMVQIQVNNYAQNLYFAYWTGEEFTPPSKDDVSILNWKDEWVENYYEGAYEQYLLYSLKRISDNLEKSTTVDEPINDKFYYNGHAYQVFNVNKIWTDAKSYCESMGGHLATITSESENEFVYSIALKAKQSDFYAIGATDVEEEGKWKWINGDNFDYNNWGKNEPNNSTECCGKGQHYAFLSMTSNSGTVSGYNFSYEPKNWNDMCIEVKYGFICEWDNYIDPYPTMKDEHHYSQTIIAPTCTTDGYTINRCTDCGLEYYSNNVSKLGHNYSFTRTINQTCTAQGYDLYTCTRCNNTEKRNIINALGHNFQYQNTVKPTCSAEGYDTYKCSQCTATEKRNKVLANGHKYAFTKTVAPTCTAQGYDLYTCSTCSATEKRNTVSSTEHSYEVTSNTATCTTAGTKTSICSKCGNKTTAESSALGHSLNKVYTAPSCTEFGGYTNTCIRCGYITNSFFEAKGHDYGEIIGINYINKISGGSKSATPGYFTEFYNTSTIIGSNSSLSKLVAIVPNEIRVDKKNIQEIIAYKISLNNSTIFGGSSKACDGVFAYDISTGRIPEQSAIPYTDDEGNLINMKYVDYKVNGNWVSGYYILSGDKITTFEETVVCTEFTETRPHIVYTRNEAIEKGIMNSDGTVNVNQNLFGFEGISFSVGIPGVYSIVEQTIVQPRRAVDIDAFSFDESKQNQIKAGKYDVNLCFYNSYRSGLGKTTFKIYDTDKLIKKTPATLSTNEIVESVCMDCGEKNIAEIPVDLTNFNIKTVSLSLESSITMNFKVLKNAVVDFENFYVVFSCGNDEMTVKEYTEQGDYYVFSYTGISPQLMNDNVTAVLHATHNGIDYASPEKIMSVRTYAYTMLKRYSTDDYAKLRTLLVDLLNYGAASQKYTGYKANNLVNADLTDTQKSWASSVNPVFNNIRDYKYRTINNPKSSWVGSGLVLNNSVTVRAKFSADDIENKTVVITCGKGEFTYSKEDFVQDKDGNYYVYCNKIFANEMSDEILLTVYDDGVACSNTMRFSIESYARLVHDNYAGNVLDELTTAMMRYGKSAQAYCV